MVKPQVTFIHVDNGGRDGSGWTARCGCGFQTSPQFTFEAAGRELDLHLAEKFPKGSERFPCPTLAHGLPFEFDPSPLQPGEGRVMPRVHGSKRDAG